MYGIPRNNPKKKISQAQIAHLRACPKKKKKNFKSHDHYVTNTSITSIYASLEVGAFVDTKISWSYYCPNNQDGQNYS